MSFVGLCGKNRIIFENKEKSQVDLFTLVYDTLLGWCAIGKKIDRWDSIWGWGKDVMGL